MEEINGTAQAVPATPPPNFRNVFHHGQPLRDWPALFSRTQLTAAGSGVMPPPAQIQDPRVSNQQSSPDSWELSEKTAWSSATETFVKRQLISHGLFEPPRTQADHAKIRAIYDAFYEAAKFSGVKLQKYDQRLRQLFTHKLIDIKRDMLAKGETVRMPEGNVVLRGAKLVGRGQSHVLGGLLPMTTLGANAVEMEEECKRPATLPPSETFSMNPGNASASPPAATVLSSDKHNDSIKLWNVMASDAQAAFFRHILRSAKSRKSLAREWNEFCAEIMSGEDGKPESRDSHSATSLEQGTTVKTLADEEEERKPLDVKEIIAQKTKELRAKRAERERAAAEAQVLALKREEDRESRDAEVEKSRRKRLEKMMHDERVMDSRRTSLFKRGSEAQAETARSNKIQDETDEDRDHMEYREERVSGDNERSCNTRGKAENGVARGLEKVSEQQNRPCTHVSQSQTEEEQQREKELQQDRPDIKKARTEAGEEIPGEEEAEVRKNVQAQGADKRLANERGQAIRQEMETPGAKHTAGTNEGQQAQRSEPGEEMNAAGGQTDSSRQQSERAQEEAAEVQSEREERARAEANRLRLAKESRDRKEQHSRQIQKARDFASTLSNERADREAERARVEAARVVKSESEARERNELHGRQVQQARNEAHRLQKEKELKEERVRKAQEVERVYAEARRLQKEKEERVKSIPAGREIAQAPIEPRADKAHRDDAVLHIKRRIEEPETDSRWPKRQSCNGRR
ncbi:hypothetical protein QTJ16_001513 [Diplocarpon rosae]|uniref:Uncharacterized protein n=1 Tax=Diplocarpon rosae TaxID=946125 RepID=A0AAD9WEI3_9HELO|nr:hypothetical protein QTJ16_001513 [Diplocarpon rosae]